VSDATIEKGSANPRVRLERELADPPAVVWRAITEPSELARWFPCAVEVDGGQWRVGAKITFTFPKDVMDMTLFGEVLAVEEPRHLAYTWGEETLTFDLVASGTGTRLVLTDELERSAAARNAAGWEECLDRLEGQESSGWRARFDRYSAAFEGELGPQEGPPADYKGKLD
jgi:uncharacterized protein YndB with AHSA1/START domain